jgi:hypothetical protein
VNWYAYCSNNPLNYTDPTGLKEISAEDLNNEDAAKGISEQKEVSKQDSSESGKYLGEIIWDYITKPVTDLKDRVLRSGAMINKSVELQVLAIISGDPSRAAMYEWEAAAIMKGAEYEAYAAVAQATKIGIDVAAIGASGAPGSIAEDMLAAPAANGASFVYRGLAKGENPALGLAARSPGADVSAASHVAGKSASPWISTTKSLDVALAKYGQNGVVKIDLSKVTTEVLDLSNGIPGIKGMLSNWAKKDLEVLIKDFVPAGAIIQ